MNSQDILIGALSAAHYIDRRRLIRETWGRDCERCNLLYLFLVGQTPTPPPDTLDNDVWNLPCPDNYNSLPQKTRQFCIRALQIPDWKWLLKTDDDSYISVPRLLQFTPPSDYVGVEWKPGVNYGSGAGYFISRAAAEIIADKMTLRAGAEDLLVGYYLGKNGINLTIDNEHIIPFGSWIKHGKRTNPVIVTHKFYSPGTTDIDQELWLKIHNETGLDAAIAEGQPI